MRSIYTFSRLGRLGRFANGAYQVSGTIGIARRNGADFGFPVWKNHDGLNFESNLDIDVYRQFVNPLPIYNGPPLKHHPVPWGYHDVMPQGSVDLEGHFQSEKYFSHCIDEIRFYMRMVNEPPLQDICGLHLRCGDYGNAPSPQHPDGNSFHPRMDMRYYEPAMSHFGLSQRFLVFSDDIPKAKEMFGDRVEYSEGRNYLDDFRLLKTCAHFIIGNSSYSAFAAVLGEAESKQVIAPRPWFGGGYQGVIDGEDIYGSDWKVINWA